MVMDCRQRFTKLTPWEQDFLDTVERQLGKGKHPSPKQYHKLEDIWLKVTAAQPGASAR